MEKNARPPLKLSSAGRLSQNWKRWKREFEAYMKITKGFEKSEDEQVAWLKNLIGPVGMTAFDKISFDDPADEKKITIVLQKLDSIFDPAKNEVEERCRFFSRQKRGNESIDAFIEELREQSSFCNFGDQAESLVRDVVIFNIKDKYLRQLLIEDSNLDLEKLKIIYKTYQINSARMMNVSKKVIAGSEKKSIESTSKATVNSQPRECSKCKTYHAFKDCPAWKNICVYCKRVGHYSHCCPSARKKMQEVEISNVCNPSSSVESKNLSSAADVNKLKD